MLNWTTLLSNHRIGQAATAEPSVRSDYQRDYDRLIFSAAFRRLKDKTQVFPLEKNDHARTRLTHSLEVSCVGRSLGSSIGQTLLQKYPELCQQNITPSDIATSSPLPALLTTSATRLLDILANKPCATTSAIPTNNPF